MLKIKKCNPLITVNVLIIGFLVMGFYSCTQKQIEEGQLPERLLLKDWQPKSIYKIPETHIQKAKYPVIDMHAHAYATTEKGIAKRVQIMNEAGVQKSIVMTGAVGAKFDSIYAKYSKYPDRFMVYSGIDFTGYKKEGWAEKAIKELRRDVKEGAKGVGELSDKGMGLSGSAGAAEGMHPDDPRMDPVFEEIGKLGIPVSLHMSDPMWMYEPMDSTNDGLMRSWTWQIKDKQGKILHKGLMKILANTLKKHPNTTFIICHLANLTYDLSKLGKLFDTYPNFYVDIGARFAEFGSIPRFAAQFMEKYQDRIVYGTDYGWETWNKHTTDGNNTTTLQMFRMTFRVLETKDDHFYLTDLLGYKWPLYGLGLTDKTLHKIYRSNALKMISKH